MSGSIQSLENIGIVVVDLAAVKAFFLELGLEQMGDDKRRKKTEPGPCRKAGNGRESAATKLL